MREMVEQVICEFAPAELAAEGFVVDRLEDAMDRDFPEVQVRGEMGRAVDGGQVAGFGVVVGDGSEGLQARMRACFAGGPAFPELAVPRLPPPRPFPGGGGATYIGLIFIFFPCKYPFKSGIAISLK